MFNFASPNKSLQKRDIPYVNNTKSTLNPTVFKNQKVELNAALTTIEEELFVALAHQHKDPGSQGKVTVLHEEFDEIDDDYNSILHELVAKGSQKGLRNMTGQKFKFQNLTKNQKVGQLLLISSEN